MAFCRPTTSRTARFFTAQKRRYANAPAADRFSINAERLWDDIHHTAQWSEPSPGGVTRLSGTVEDKAARDWFRDQVRLLGAEYAVNATGTQFARFEGRDNTVAPIAMGSHMDTVATGDRFDGPLGVIGGLEVTNEEGARFFPPLGSSCVFAGQSSVRGAHLSAANNGSGETLGQALQSIDYVGDGPNTFEEFPLSAHFEIHVEQHTDLEKAGKPVGWVEGWQGISVYEATMRGEDGHANTYPMYGRKDALVGAAQLICEIENMAFDFGRYTTSLGIRSGPVGSCNIQSYARLMFCLMNQDSSGVDAMCEAVVKKAKGIASKHGLELDMSRTMHLAPGSFWPEAIDCVRRACGDKGIGSKTLTAHDSTMTRLKCPTTMVFARAKGGISHCAKEWTSKEDCAESALVLGRAVLNFDQHLAGEAC